MSDKFRIDGAGWYWTRAGELRWVEKEPYGHDDPRWWKLADAIHAALDLAEGKR